MGWAFCGKDALGRETGYGVAAVCDLVGCGAKIDRGLGYACGGMHGDEGVDGQPACAGYFCDKHLDKPLHSCASDDDSEQSVEAE